MEGREGGREGGTHTHTHTQRERERERRVEWTCDEDAEGRDGAKHTHNAEEAGHAEEPEHLDVG